MSADRYDQAVEYFQQAVEEDPQFARAYAALAEAYAWLGVWRGGEDYRDIAKAAALKATQLAPELTEGWLALGHTELQLNFDWRAAERAYAKAGETTSGILGLDGMYLILAGRFDEGIAFFERRIELDPLNRDGFESLGWAYLCSRRFDDAIASYQKNSRIFPGHHERYIESALVQCFGFKGMFDDAFAMIEKRKPPSEESETTEANSTTSDERWHAWQYPYLVVHTHACAGNKGEVQKLIDRYDDNPNAAFDIAEMCAAVGFKEKALQKLEEAWRVEPEEVMWLNACPLFDPLKDDPRFIAFRDRVGIPPIQWSSTRPWSPPR
jgi:tetratricopeptide (TPR) repeat protein